MKLTGKTFKHYETCAIYPIEKFLELLKSNIKSIRIKELGKDIKLSLNENRLRVFLKSAICYKCGRQSEMVAVQRDHGLSRFNHWHLNIYSSDGSLMTRDHLVPKSKGGSDDLDNSGVLCMRCNSKKSDKSVEQFLNK